MDELRELKGLSEGADDDALDRNRRIFDGNRYQADEAVIKRVKSIKEEDYTRKPLFEEREKSRKQSSHFRLFFRQRRSVHFQTKDVKANCTGLSKGTVTKNSTRNSTGEKIKMYPFQEEIDLTYLFMVNTNVTTW